MELEERKVTALEAIAKGLQGGVQAGGGVQAAPGGIAVMERNTASNNRLAGAVNGLTEALLGGYATLEGALSGTLSGSTLGEETSAESAKIDAEELTQELQDAKKGEASGEPERPDPTGGLVGVIGDCEHDS